MVHVPSHFNWSEENGRTNGDKKKEQESEDRANDWQEKAKPHVE